MKNILVVCQSGSVLSPIVAALFNARSKHSWRAWSAASEPQSRVNPYTYAVLKEAGIAHETALSPVDWRAFSGASAPRLEVVLTVSEDVAWEMMPSWNGVPRLLHWALPDPMTARSSAVERFGLVRAWCDLAVARVEMFLAEEVTTRAAGPDNDNRGIRLRGVGT